MLVNQAGEPKGVLARGEQKSLQTDRVILVPAPTKRSRSSSGSTTSSRSTASASREIAADLNTQGLVTDLGRPWTRGTVHQVLTNEKYVGNNVYNRTSFKLKKKHVRNPPDMWVRADGAFEAIVDPEAFYIGPRHHPGAEPAATPTRTCWRACRPLVRSTATVSGQLIDASRGHAAQRRRTGPGSAACSTPTASRVIEPDRDYRYVEINRDLRRLYPDLVVAT